MNDTNVWRDDKPCGYCDKGLDSGQPCRRCAGTGVRSERAELVERVIALTSENRVLHQIIRDLAQGDDSTPAGLLVAKQAEIEILQRNQRKLLAEREGKAA